MEEFLDNALEEEKRGVEAIKDAFNRHMALTLGKNLGNSTNREKFRALALAIRDRIVSRWLITQNHYQETNPKRVYYFSLEFLMGRTMHNALVNLDLVEEFKEVANELGFSLDNIEDLESDAGLGNGGLGRLAACFLDSMATLDLPACGYGIRYEYGMFNQQIIDDRQYEFPDNWLRYGTPWEFVRPADFYMVKFMGNAQEKEKSSGDSTYEWVTNERVIALAHDYLIPGYKTDTVNTLRLWSAKSTREFNLESFNTGNYIGAVHNKSQSEVISKVLYPNDNNYEGKELRLKQQYFMVSASLQDILASFTKGGNKLENLPDKVAIQLNDTHPSIAIPELMRILVDEENFSWEKAWDITTRTFAYTNHTVLPEALETWPISLLEKVLPRHMQILYKINHIFLDQITLQFPGDFERKKQLSLIGEDGEKHIRMANLAIVGSHSVNGVAALHSHLLKTTIFRYFYELWPEKFNNKTNGITPRRWIKVANPSLTRLISTKIAEDWIKDLNHLRQLEGVVNDEGFLQEWQKVKLCAKETLATIIQQKCGIIVNPASMFDVQVKRIHEYKRQLLNLMHVITLYNRIKADPNRDWTPRTVIFGGKAAPGYERAKLIIHLINSAAKIINHDKVVGDRLKLVFIPNYGVSLAEKIIPAADLSEQVSTAGMEASGTGNMKFALNGALTIGTLDGANIEIKEEVGDENIFIFGHTVEELNNLRPHYNPWDYYSQDSELNQVMDQINKGYFSTEGPDQFQSIFNSLVHEGDHYFHLADYRMYLECQERVSELFRNPTEWHKKGILNVARIGKFSSDRVIHDYAEEIWHIKSSQDRTE